MSKRNRQRLEALTRQAELLMRMRKFTTNYILDEYDPPEELEEKRRLIAEEEAAGGKPLVINIVREYIDPKTLEKLSEKRIAEIKAREEEIRIQMLADGRTGNTKVDQANREEANRELEPEPVVSRPKVTLTPKPEPKRNTRPGWWDASNLIDADFAYRERHEETYRKYTTQSQIDRWANSNLAPPPLGANIGNWPPNKEKDWDKCKEVFRQRMKEIAELAREDRELEKEERDLLRVARQMEKERTDWEDENDNQPTGYKK